MEGEEGVTADESGRREGKTEVRKRRGAGRRTKRKEKVGMEKEERPETEEKGEQTEGTMPHSPAPFKIEKEIRIDKLQLYMFKGYKMMI